MEANKFDKRCKKEENQIKEKPKKGRFDDYWKSMGGTKWTFDLKSVMK